MLPLKCRDAAYRLSSSDDFLALLGVEWFQDPIRLGYCNAAQVPAARTSNCIAVDEPVQVINQPLGKASVHLDVSRKVDRARAIGSLEEAVCRQPT